MSSYNPSKELSRFEQADVDAAKDFLTTRLEACIDNVMSVLEHYIDSCPVLTSKLTDEETQKAKSWIWDVVTDIADKAIEGAQNMARVHGFELEVAKSPWQKRKAAEAIEKALHAGDDDEEAVAAPSSLSFADLLASALRPVPQNPQTHADKGEAL